MTAARAGSPLCSPFRVKNARVTDSDGLISCGRTADFLVKTAAAALRLDVQSEAKRMCVTEWGKRGGLDGTLICALCDFTPITYRAENFPRHGSCRSGDGCYSCNLDFYTSRVCERTGKTVTLCEFCYEGEWTRFGRRAFEVVRPVKLFLVDCAESLVWGYEAFGGHMLRDALRQGIEMVRYRVPWDSLVDESLENELRGLVLEGAFSDYYKYRLFRTSTNLSGAWYKFNVCRLRPTHFGLPAKVRQFFVLASIATMIAAAATVTTHHHHRNSYAPNLKVLCLCYGKTFCVGCIRVSIYFGTNRKFQHTSRAIAADFQR
jgi:hypothetical protein